MGTNKTGKVFITNIEVPWEETGPGIKRKIIAWDERLMLVKVQFEKSAIGTLHKHPHSQITHVESGTFEVEIGDDKRILSSRDSFYIPPDVMHGVFCLEEGVLIDVFSPMREDFVKNANGR